MELYHKSKDGRILVFDLKGKEKQLKIYREKHLGSKKDISFYQVKPGNVKSAELIVKDHVKTVLENPDYEYILSLFHPYTDEAWYCYKQAINMYLEGALAHIKPAIPSKEEDFGFLMNRFLIERRAYYLKLPLELLKLQLLESGEWNKILENNYNIEEILKMFSMDYQRTIENLEEALETGKLSEEEYKEIINKLASSEEIIKIKTYSNIPPVCSKCNSFF